jgi:hypothetical protein
MGYSNEAAAFAQTAGGGLVYRTVSLSGEQDHAAQWGYGQNN